MEAKQSQALFSFGQQLGHFFPGVYTGWVPASQKPGSAKHSQVWSFVAFSDLPGQHPSSQSHGTVSHLGQILEHCKEDGRRWRGGGSYGGVRVKGVPSRNSLGIHSFPFSDPFDP